MKCATLSLFIILLANSPIRANNLREALAQTLQYGFLKPQGIQYKKYSLLRFPHRNDIPLVGSNRFKYLYFSHRNNYYPRDLVFLVPGIGSLSEGNGSRFLAEKIFSMGYNVVVVDNTFTQSFAVQVSTTGMPGRTRQDARDMLFMMEKVLAHLKSKNQIWKNVKLTGFSLGGLVAGHIAEQDSLSDRPIGFKKVVLMNPPSSIQTCLENIDALYKTGEHFSFFETVNIFLRFLGLFNIFETQAPDKPWQGQLNTRVKTISTDVMSFIVGRSLVSSLGDIVHASQQIFDQKILYPSNKEDLYRKIMAGRFTFKEYIDGIVIPYTQKYENSDKTREEIIFENGLLALSQFFYANDSVYLIHNNNDMIVVHEELKEIILHFRSNRYTVYDHGGHLGNIWTPKYLDQLQRYLE